MPMYTFHFCNSQGMANGFEAFDLPQDADAFAKAGDLLDQHLSCDHVDVREGDRPVLARHRYQPVIRPLSDALNPQA